MSKHLFRNALRFFFHHFYHGFAWTYDAVAAFVSLGRWNEWIETVVPYLRGPRVLEIGHGPGHLQALMQPDSSLLMMGVDESAQMGRLARRRVRRAPMESPRLTRAIAQRLPFREAMFETVVATFPTEFIFDLQTLKEVGRVMTGSGRLIVVPAAWIVGGRLLERAAAWLFRVTGQAPPSADEVILQRIVRPFQEAGFQTTTQRVAAKSSLVVLIIATK